MITDKFLIFLVIVTSIPFAYSRNAPLSGQKLFPRDSFEGRYHSRQPQDGRTSEYQVTTQNHNRELEIVDFIENVLNSHEPSEVSEQNEVRDQQNQQIEIVDLNGNVANSDIDKYEVNHEKSHEIVGNFEKPIPESHNSRQKHHVRRSENQANTLNQTPELEIVDINKNVGNSPKDEYEVQYQQIEIVYINGNAADLEKDKYKVENQDNHKISVDLKNEVPEPQNLFPHDIVMGRHNSRQKHHVRRSESQANISNQTPELEIVDINKNVGISPIDEYEVQDQQIEIVDINGNAADFEKDKYEVQHQDNHEITVDLKNEVPESQKLFPSDIVKGRHNSRQKHHVRRSESQSNTSNQTPELEIVDINGNVGNSPKDEYEVQDQKIEIVDVNGNAADLEKDKYEVQHQDNHEMQHQDNHKISVNLKNEVPERQNLVPHDIVKGRHNSRQKHHVRRSESQANTSNQAPEVEIVDINENIVNSRNGEYQVENHQNPETQVISTIENVINNGQNSENGEIVNDSENDSPSYKVCQTDECKTLADDYLKSLNKSVDPCENFYEFSCGGWLASHILKPNQIVNNRITMVENSIRRIKQEILGSEIQLSDILPVKNAKKWYRSCINTERIERSGLQPVVSIMMQVGGWPMTMDDDEWDENAHSWQSIERHYARLTGAYIFYDFAATYRSNRNAVGNITIDTPTFTNDKRIQGWLRGYADGTKYDYQALILKVVRLFIEHNQGTVSEERLRKESQEMMSFLKELSELTSANAPAYYISLEELIRWYNSNETDSKLGSPASGVNWNKLIQDLFNEVNIKVIPSTNIYIKNAGYVKGIGELLKRTPLRTIVNYIHWNFIATMWEATTEEIRDLFSNSTLKTISRDKQKEQRSWECTSKMEMTHATAYVFVKKYFTQEIENAAHEIIDNVRMEMEQNIERSNWLDPESKVLVKEKLSSMKSFVGYPNWYNNKTAMVNSYKGITIGVDYFDNCLSYARYNKKRTLEKYTKPFPDYIPFSNTYAQSASVYAFYWTIENFFGISAGAFQSPFFGIGFPKYSEGITFGKDGEKTELSDTTLRSFYDRVECFVEQFDKYHGNPKIVNGTIWNCNSTDRSNATTDGQKSAGDNIADTTGLQAAFQAYKTSSKKKNPNGEMRLPGLEEFTDDQLFFLSYAETWCEVQSPIYQKFLHDIDYGHSSPDLRVIGVLSNTKDFAKAFNCPIGSSMNPTNKCSIWDKP